MTTARSTWLMFSILACSVAACGGSVAPDGGDGGVLPDATSAEVGADVSTMDAAPEAAPDSGPGVQDAQPDRPIVPNRGGAITASVIGASGFNQSIGAAGFYELMGTNPSGSCRQRTFATCRVTDCRAMGGGDAGAGDGGTTGRRANAGTITIAGGMAAMPMTLTPDANGNYRAVTENGTRWRAGDMLTFSAAGADVPAFSAMLTFPTPITVTDPMNMFAPVPINRAMGFTARWMPGTGDVTIFIARAGNTGGVTGAVNSGVAVECVFPSAGGMGTVPSDALTDLEPTTSTFPPQAMVAVTARATTEVTAGEYRVQVNATGGGFAGIAQIQ